MTEGELKKRIDSMEVKDIDEVFHPYTIVNIKDVWTILDEAKADFPKINHKHDCETPFYLWFRKWFGESK